MCSLVFQKARLNKRDKITSLLSPMKTMNKNRRLEDQGVVDYLLRVVGAQNISLIEPKTDCIWFLELLKIGTGREGISFSCVIAVPISAIFSSFLFVDWRREREKSYFLVCVREILFQFFGRERTASFVLVFFENELGKLVIN